MTFTSEEWHKIHPYVRYGYFSWKLWEDFSGDFSYYLEESQTPQTPESNLPFPKVYLYEREFDKLYVDEILDLRELAREYKNWELSDIIRNYLDKKNVFVFDTKAEPDIYYLTEDYFKDIEKIEKIHSLKFETRRKFVEWNIKRNIKAENNFDAWLFSINASSNTEKQKENYDKYIQETTKKKKLTMFNYLDSKLQVKKNISSL